MTSLIEFVLYGTAIEFIKINSISNISMHFGSRDVAS